jgi:hypothetical protein
MLLGNPEYTSNLGRAAYQRCRRMFDWQVIAEFWKSLLHRSAQARANAQFDRRAS